MPTPLPVVYCFNTPGASRQVVPGSGTSANWSTLLRINGADVGDPLDEIVWIVHLRIGNADLSPLTSAIPAARLGVRIADQTSSLQRVFNMDIRGGQPEAPIVSAQQQGCVTYAAIHRAATPTVGTNAALTVQATLVTPAGQTGGLTSITIQIEDLTVTAWNLTRLTAKSIAWAWADGNFTTRLTPGLVPQNIGGTIALTAPASGTRTWLCYGAGVSDNHSRTRSTFWRMLEGASVLVGPVGSSTRSFTPEVDKADWLHQALLGVVEIASTDPPSTLQMQAWDDFTTTGLHSMALQRQLFAVDISTLNPAWNMGNDPAVGDGADTMYGAPAGNPNFGEQAPPRVISQGALGQHRIVHAFASPLADHSPRLRVTFASEVRLNGTADLPSSRQDPLYVIAMSEVDRMPDYQSASFRSGRGVVVLDHFGWYHPSDDPIDSLGNPTRITNARGSSTTRSFYGVAQCLVAFDAWKDTLAEPEDPVAVGPTVYVVPGRESVDPADLSRLRYPPRQVLAAEAVHRGVSIESLDGRVLSWGTFLAPREVWTVSWHVKTAGSTPTRDVLLAFLRGLEHGLFGWEHPITSELRAWCLSGATLREQSLSGGAWEISVDVVELTWTS